MEKKNQLKFVKNNLQTKIFKQYLQFPLSFLNPINKLKDHLIGKRVSKIVLKKINPIFTNNCGITYVNYQQNKDLSHIQKMYFEQTVYDQNRYNFIRQNNKHTVYNYLNHYIFLTLLIKKNVN